MAILCHDIGKVIETIGHEKHSVGLCNDYLSAKSLWLIEHHLRVRDMFDGGIKKLKKVHYLLTHPWLQELIHVARLDKLGRNPNVKKLLTNKDIMDKLNIAVEKRYEVVESYQLGRTH